MVFIDIIDSKDDQPGSASNPIPVDSNEQTVSDKTIQASISSDKDFQIIKTFTKSRHFEKTISATQAIV